MSDWSSFGARSRSLWQSRNGIADLLTIRFWHKTKVKDLARRYFLARCAQTLLRESMALFIQLGSAEPSAGGAQVEIEETLGQGALYAAA
jgi:hypothetical protein